MVVDVSAAVHSLLLFRAFRNTGLNLTGLLQRSSTTRWSPKGYNGEIPFLCSQGNGPAQHPSFHSKTTPSRSLWIYPHPPFRSRGHSNHSSQYCPKRTSNTGGSSVSTSNLHTRTGPTLFLNAKRYFYAWAFSPKCLHHHPLLSVQCLPTSPIVPLWQKPKSKKSNESRPP